MSQGSGASQLSMFKANRLHIKKCNASLLKRQIHNIKSLCGHRAVGIGRVELPLSSRKDDGLTTSLNPLSGEMTTSRALLHRHGLRKGVQGMAERRLI